MEEYKIVRNIMIELGELGGFVINPRCLQEYILKFLKTVEPNNKMNSMRARNVSYVFAVMCNEFYLINQNRISQNEFYVRQERWNQMNIRQKMLESSLKILKKISLIDFKNIVHPTHPYGFVKMYTINIAKLSKIKDEIGKEMTSANHLLLDTTSNDDIIK